jgi:hypothetical protein
MLYPVSVLVLMVVVGPVGAQPSVTDPAPPADPTSQPGATPPAHGEHVWTPDDETIDPSQIPVEAPPPPPRYPRTFVARPLLLPSGRAEGVIAPSFAQETVGEDFSVMFAALSLSGRIAIGPVEPYVGLRFVPFHTDIDGELPMLQRAFLGTRLALVEQFALGVEGGVAAFGSGLRLFWGEVFASYRVRPSDRGTITLTGGGDLEHYRASHRDYVDTSVATANGVSAFARMTVQLQLTPELAVEAFGRIGVFSFLDDDAYRRDSYETSYAYGGGPLISVGERTDLVPYFSVSVLPSGRVTSGGISVVVR